MHGKSNFINTHVPNIFMKRVTRSFADKSENFQGSIVFCVLPYSHFMATRVFSMKQLYSELVCLTLSIAYVLQSEWCEDLECVFGESCSGDSGGPKSAQLLRPSNRRHLEWSVPRWPTFISGSAGWPVFFFFFFLSSK